MAGGTFEGGVVGRGGIHDARFSHSIRALRSPLMASSVAVLACVIVLLAGGNGVPLPTETLDRATLTLGVISKALFLGAGLVQLARWRITSGHQELYWGSALIVLGGVSLPLTTLAAVISADREDALLSPLTSVSVAFVAATLMILGLRQPSTWNARVDLVLVAAAAAGTLTFGTLTVLHFATPALMHTQALPTTLARGALLSIVWTGVAVFRSTRLRPDPRSDAVPTLPILCGLALAELARVASALLSDGWMGLSALLMIAVAVAAGVRAFRDLTAAMVAERAALTTVTDALHSARIVAELEHERQQEIEHDARNALAGLRAALLTIDRYGSRLDAGTVGRLRRAALGEVHELEHLIVYDREEPVVDFDLDPVVRATVDARRAAGCHVTLVSLAVRVRGRPTDLATALGNLLANAAQHGAGPISVTARRLSGHVAIDVADRGPGIAADRADSVFERGVKGNASTGNGLGLSVARARMRHQDGDVLLRSREGGCVFTIRIPMSSATARVVALDLPAQRETSATNGFLSPRRRREGTAP